MLTLNKCKIILGKEAEELSDDEILIIRDWLEKLADITIESNDFSLIPELK